MPTPEKAEARSQLFAKFIKKLEIDTTLIEQYGGDLEIASKTLNFATAVRYEMLNAEKDERFKQQVPSAHTLLRWLQRKDFSAQVQTRSVLAVSRFLGYEHFDDFEDSLALTKPVGNEDLQEAGFVAAQFPKDEEKSKTSGPTKRVALWGLLGLTAVMLFSYGGALLLAERSQPTNDLPELNVKRFIEQVNQYELDLYKQVGRQPLDTAQKQYFFTQNSPAWKTISKVLVGSVDLEYVLNLDRSKRALIFAKVEEATDSTLLVHTREAWTVIWESDISVNTRYDEINDQYYTLHKEDDRWKVHLNAYTGMWTPDE